MMEVIERRNYKKNCINFIENLILCLVNNYFLFFDDFIV